MSRGDAGWRGGGQLRVFSRWSLMPNPILGTKVHLSDVFDDITVFGGESLKTEHSSSCTHQLGIVA